MLSIRISAKVPILSNRISAKGPSPPLKLSISNEKTTLWVMSLWILGTEIYIMYLGENPSSSRQYSISIRILYLYPKIQNILWCKQSLINLVLAQMKTYKTFFLFTIFYLCYLLLYRLTIHFFKKLKKLNAQDFKYIELFCSVCAISF